MNHTSFMDMFVVLSSLPFQLLRDKQVRPVASASLIDQLPVIGPTFAYSGALKVYFRAKGSGFGKAENENDFSVPVVLAWIEPTTIPPMSSLSLSLLVGCLRPNDDLGSLTDIGDDLVSSGRSIGIVSRLRRTSSMRTSPAVASSAPCQVCASPSH